MMVDIDKGAAGCPERHIHVQFLPTILAVTLTCELLTDISIFPLPTHPDLL
jgi:hypothetical protein